DSVVPATVFIASGFLAPHAWPISTAAPEPSPMMKAMKKNRIGKNADTAASAFTPSMCPTYTLLSVPDNDCRMLARISGPRKATKVRHSGRGVGTAEGAVMQPPLL